MVPSLSSYTIAGRKRKKGRAEEVTAYQGMSYPTPLTCSIPAGRTGGPNHDPTDPPQEYGELVQKKVSNSRANARHTVASCTTSATQQNRNPVQ
jgi:hypothetical protein